MSEQEKKVGERVRLYRELAMLPQQDLAARMRVAGFKWAQATVWSVESGDRPLRLTEAAKVSEICGIDPASFFETNGPSADIDSGLELAIRTLEDLRKNVR